jgi:hypothetical protein
MRTASGGNYAPRALLSPLGAGKVGVFTASGNLKAIATHSRRALARLWGRLARLGAASRRGSVTASSRRHRDQDQDG